MYFYCFFSFEFFYLYDHYAACWVTLTIQGEGFGKLCMQTFWGGGWLVVGGGGRGDSDGEICACRVYRSHGAMTVCHIDGSRVWGLGSVWCKALFGDCSRVRPPLKY